MATPASKVKSEAEVKAAVTRSAAAAAAAAAAATGSGPGTPVASTMDPQTMVLMAFIEQMKAQTAEINQWLSNLKKGQLSSSPPNNNTLTPPTVILPQESLPNICKPPTLHSLECASVRSFVEKYDRYVMHYSRYQKDRGIAKPITRSIH